MKTWILSGIVVASLVVSAPGLACGVAEGVRRPVEVRPVQNVSFQVSEMFERASRLENIATSHDSQARAFEQEAELLSNRARVLRNQASLVDIADRGSLLTIADELGARAMTSRSRAGQQRAQASELRLEARTLRQRAIALSGGGGGGGWRVKRVSPDVRTVAL